MRSQIFVPYFQKILQFIFAQLYFVSLIMLLMDKTSDNEVYEGRITTGQCVPNDVGELEIL